MAIMGRVGAIIENKHSEQGSRKERRAAITPGGVLLAGKEPS